MLPDNELDTVIPRVRHLKQKSNVLKNNYNFNFMDSISMRYIIKAVKYHICEQGFCYGITFPTLKHNLHFFKFRNIEQRKEIREKINKHQRVSERFFLKCFR